jgi:ABC-type hemin transport system ATPase subunit
MGKENIDMTDNQDRDSAGVAEEKAFLPPLDFSSIIAPFYTQALIKLGLLNDPSGDQSGENLPLARRLIDLLDLLQDRTQGRLEADEEKFLESVLAQLKMHYIEKSDAIKL